MKPVAIFRHSPGEGPGYFATFLERHVLPWQLISIDAGTPVPQHASQFSGLAFMGGPMSVNDTLPWIAEECALIRSAVACEIPVIGHCLGAQLMAKALGGSVTRNAVKEIGWGEMSVSDNNLARAWLGNVQSFLSFHWHSETFTLPPGAIQIMASPYCQNQAFALGPHLAMQCHVEMTRAMIMQWSISGAAEISSCNDLSVQKVTAIEQDMDTKLAALHAVADRIYMHWISGLRRD